MQHILILGDYCIFLLVNISLGYKGLFDSYFLKLLLKTIFEITENIIFVLSEDCCCFLDQMFFVFFCVFINSRKLRTKRVLHVFLVFENRKQFSNRS